MLDFHAARREKSGWKGKVPAEIVRNAAVCRDSVYRRLRAGWTLEKALRTPSRRHQIVVDGARFATIAEACAAFDVHPSVVSRRMKSGEKVGRRLFRPAGKAGAHGREFSVGGQTFPSRAAAARAYGFQANTLWARLKRGMTPEEAVSRSGFRGSAPRVSAEETRANWERERAASDREKEREARERERLRKRKMAALREGQRELDGLNARLGTTFRAGAAAVLTGGRRVRIAGAAGEMGRGTARAAVGAEWAVSPWDVWTPVKVPSDCWFDKAALREGGTNEADA